MTEKVVQSTFVDRDSNVRCVDVIGARSCRGQQFDVPGKRSGSTRETLVSTAIVKFGVTKTTRSGSTQTNGHVRNAHFS